MRLDHILLETLIEHAKKGDTEAAERILKMLDSYTSKGSPIPDILSGYMAEAAKKIDDGMTHDKAFNLSRRQGNQYSRDTTLKEINIARFVYSIQNFLKNHRTIDFEKDREYLTLYKAPSKDAIEHLNTNFNPTLDSILEWLDENDMVPYITKNSAKKSNSRKFMTARNIRDIYDRWIKGIRATEE